MSCISILVALGYKQPNVILENHYNKRNIEDALISRRWNRTVKEESYYYNQVGLDSLIRRIHSNLMDENTIQASSISFCENLLYYIPQSHITNKEYFEYELSRVIHVLMRKLEHFHGMVTIDTAGSEHLSSKVILELSDLVVVNLSQDPTVLEDFFQNYSNLRQKAIYLIGSYNPYSRCTLKNIMRQYEIKKDELAVIPYNIEFHDAFLDGSLIKFLTRNYFCKKNDENYFFIREAKRATKMLLNKLSQLKGEEP